MVSTGETLALKKIEVQDNIMDRELDILNQLSVDSHPNIVQVHSSTHAPRHSLPSFPSIMLAVHLPSPDIPWFAGCSCEARL